MKRRESVFGSWPFQSSIAPADNRADNDQLYGRISRLIFEVFREAIDPCRILAKI